MEHQHFHTHTHHTEAEFQWGVSIHSYRSCDDKYSNLLECVTGRVVTNVSKDISAFVIKGQEAEEEQHRITSQKT